MLQLSTRLASSTPPTADSSSLQHVATMQQLGEVQTDEG